MGKITYTIKNGTLPVLVTLRNMSNVVVSQTFHYTYGTFFFDNITPASYTITFTDARGCTTSYPVSYCANCADGFVPYESDTCIGYDIQNPTYTSTSVS